MNPKSIFCIAALCLLLTNCVFAQYISIGPTIGLHHSWVTVSLADDDKRIIFPRFDIGGSVVYSDKSHIGFGADVLYNQQGSGIKYNGDKFRFKTSYLQIPLRIIYFLGEYGQNMRPKIFLGPTLGFLLSAKSEGFDVKDQTKSFDAGLHVGAGLNFKVASGIWLNTDITYSQGFIDVTKDVAGNSDNNLNGSVGINVGLLWGK
ncbi:MAG: PorT family protein [Chitinophagales bacterium]|nr:PorT family protein [Chitinophagales bacterium]